MVRMKLRSRARTPGAGPRFLLPKFMRCRLPCLQYADSDAGTDLQNDSLLDDHELHDDVQPLTSSNSSAAWGLGYTPRPVRQRGAACAADIDSNRVFDSVHEQNNTHAGDVGHTASIPNINLMSSQNNLHGERAGPSTPSTGIDSDSQFTDRNNCKLPNFRQRMWRSAFTAGYDKNTIPRRQNSASTSTMGVGEVGAGLQEGQPGPHSSRSCTLMDDSLTLLDNNFSGEAAHVAAEVHAERMSDRTSEDNVLLSLTNTSSPRGNSDGENGLHSGREVDRSTPSSLLDTDVCDTASVLPVETDLFLEPRSQLASESQHNVDETDVEVEADEAGVGMLSSHCPESSQSESEETDAARVDDGVTAASAPSMSEASMGLQAALLDFLNGGLPTSTVGQHEDLAQETSDQASGHTPVDTLGSGHSSCSSNSELLRQILHSLNGQVTYAGSVRMRSPDSSQSSSNQGSMNPRHQENWYFYDHRLGASADNTPNNVTPTARAPPITSLPSAGAVVSPPTYEEAQAQAQLLKLFQPDMAAGAEGGGRQAMPSDPPPPYLLPEVGVPPPAYSDNGSEHSSLGEVPPYRSHPNSQASGASSASGSLSSRSLSTTDVSGSTSSDSLTRCNSRLSPPRGRLLLFNQGHSLLSFVGHPPLPIAAPPDTDPPVTQPLQDLDAGREMIQDTNVFSSERLPLTYSETGAVDADQFRSIATRLPMSNNDLSGGYDFPQPSSSPPCAVPATSCGSREESGPFRRRSGSGQSAGQLGFRPAVMWNRGMGLDRWAPTQSWASEFRIGQ